MTDILSIGRDLVEARRSQGLTQRELAERLGVKQQQIARWETTSYRTASLERVAAVAAALGYEQPVAPSLLAAEAPATYGAQSVSDAAEPGPTRDLGEVARRIREHGAEFKTLGVSRIGVFGSFATGEQTADSDVDLLVEFSAKPSGLAYMQPPMLAETVLGRRVDWTQKALLRPRLRERVLREVVYVWQA